MVYRVITHADFVYAEFVEAESEEQAMEIHEKHKQDSSASDWEFCDDLSTDAYPEE